MAPTPENFKPRQIADMTNTLANLQPGDQLTHVEIQLLAKINGANVAAMRKSLEAEKNAIYPHYTSAENEEHRAYWQERIAELDKLVVNYNGNLAKITLVATSDLALLLQAHNELEALKKSGDPVSVKIEGSNVDQVSIQGVITKPVGAPTATAKPLEEVKVISDLQFQEIQKIFENPKKDITTATVRNNAGAIVSALKKGTKFSDVKIAIDSLVDKAQIVEQFQVLLGRRKDGTIGSGDILALLRKAGVDEKHIPQAIKDKADNEGKKAEKKAVVLNVAEKPTPPTPTPVAPIIPTPAPVASATVPATKPTEKPADLSRETANGENILKALSEKPSNLPRGITKTDDGKKIWKGNKDNPEMAKIVGDTHTIVWDVIVGEKRLVYIYENANQQLVACLVIDQKGGKSGIKQLNPTSPVLVNDISFIPTINIIANVK